MDGAQPIACSLGTGDLKKRLAEIAATGEESLASRESDGSRHLLRFRSDAKTRRRLEAIVAAEAQCCSFLHLALEQRGDELLLSITWPNEGRAVADELAQAFAGTTRRRRPCRPPPAH